MCQAWQKRTRNSCKLSLLFNAVILSHFHFLKCSGKVFFRKAMLFSKSNLLQSRKVKMIYYKIREGLPNIICKKVLSKEVLGNNFSHFWIIQLRSNENKSIHRCCSEASFSMFRIPQYEWIGQYRQDCLSQASLTAQGYRIRPQMQETQVQSLVQEDPTCRRATKPMRYSC